MLIKSRKKKAYETSTSSRINKQTTSGIYHQKRLNELNQKQEPSSWLTTLPILVEGYDLTNSTILRFYDSTIHHSTIIANEARLDICARDFWQTGQMAFFDVRDFNSTVNQDLS